MGPPYSYFVFISKACAFGVIKYGKEIKKVNELKYFTSFEAEKQFFYQKKDIIAYMTKKHPYKEVVLPNKLKVLLYPMESVMSVHMVVFVKVGAIYEKQDERGISHFTEHMAFLGTKKYPSPLATSQAAQKFGAKNNASTSRLRTLYWVSLPYTNVADGIDLLYQFVFEPLIKDADVNKEKGVILSEYNDFWHNPDRRFNHESWRKRFRQREHPYSYRALGLPKTIKSFEKKDILAWRQKNYHPANMIVSVTGNVDENQILKIIEKSFGKKRAGVKRKEPKFNTNDYSNFSTFIQKEKRPQIKFIISFPAFGRKEFNRRKRMQLGLLNRIFGVGPASRLFQRLREKEKLVYRVGSEANLHTWMGALEIWGSVPVEKLQPAMKILREEIDKLIKGGVSQKEMELSRNQMKAYTLMRFDNPESIAYFFGYQVFDEEEVWFPEDYIREFKKITKRQLGNLAKEIINYSKVNISLMGDIPQKKIKEVEQIFKK